MLASNLKVAVRGQSLSKEPSAGSCIAPVEYHLVVPGLIHPSAWTSGHSQCSPAAPAMCAPLCTSGIAYPLPPLRTGELVRLSARLGPLVAPRRAAPNAA